MPRISTIVMVNVDKTSCVEFPVEVRYNTADDRGWIEGRIEIQYGTYSYEFEAKVYDTPSHNGIDDGCISKLYIKDIMTDTEVIGYDRGWYLEPHCPQEYAALNALLTIFDTPQEWEVLD